VRFASECLAFANVPERPMVDALQTVGASPGHPRWKASVPRDAGASWDFEDVRDHYVRQTFGVDPTELRARDPERYLAFGRVATGEAMLRTFAEWRRAASPCRGGLVWFARDLQPGAGWGVIDSDGRAKAAYWYLRRAWTPVALLACDEGLNGLQLHAVNDTDMPIEADVRVTLYHHGRQRGVRGTAALTIPARGEASVHADALFEGFLDLTYAYRFGPPGHDVVAAVVIERDTGRRLGDAQIFPVGLPVQRDPDLHVTASAVSAAGGFVLELTADRFAHAVVIEADDHVPDDNYLHLEPGDVRRVFLRGTNETLQATVTALNAGAAAIVTASASMEVSQGGR
jgi:beta-mannosidase